VSSIWFHEDYFSCVEIHWCVAVSCGADLTTKFSDFNLTSLAFISTIGLGHDFVMGHHHVLCHEEVVTKSERQVGGVQRNSFRS